MRNRAAVLLLAASVLVLGAAPAIAAPAKPAAATAPASPAQAALGKVMTDYEAWRLSEDPFSAGMNGDQAALSKLPDITPAGDARRKTALLAFKGRIDAIDAGKLDEGGKLNHAF